MAEKDGPELDKMIDEFKRISSERIMRDYEKKNRARIGEASLIVKDAFDKQWKNITGNSYYQPVTTVSPALPQFGKNNTERSDPRSRQYRTTLTFSAIQWQKIRRKIGKKVKDFYSLTGESATTQTRRPIYQNLDLDRLKDILGPKSAEEILSVKSIDYGEIKGTFDLKVEGYWEVIFSPAKSENDPIDVRLMWEGQCLVIKRMIPVVLPGFYIEVADNATRDHYIQNPEQGRKKVGIIQEYPYTVLREATREEYLTQKAHGDQIMREKRVRDE